MWGLVPGFPRKIVIFATTLSQMLQNIRKCCSSLFINPTCVQNHPTNVPNSVCCVMSGYVLISIKSSLQCKSGPYFGKLSNSSQITSYVTIFKRGVPQGSILGPVLYIFYTYELSRKIANIAQFPDEQIVNLGKIKVIKFTYRHTSYQVFLSSHKLNWRHHT